MDCMGVLSCFPHPEVPGNLDAVLVTGLPCFSLYQGMELATCVVGVWQTLLQLAGKLLLRMLGISMTFCDRPMSSLLLYFGKLVLQPGLYRSASADVQQTHPTTRLLQHSETASWQVQFSPVHCCPPSGAVHGNS